MFTWPAIFLYAVSRLGLSSSKGTSTVNRTRVGFRVSRALFTFGWLLWDDGDDNDWGIYARTGEETGICRGGETRTPDLLPPKQAR